jgi:hypothetical protein
MWRNKWGRIDACSGQCYYAGAVIPPAKIPDMMNYPLKKHVLVSAAILAALFLSVDAWFLFQRSFSETRRVVSQDGYFHLRLLEFFSPFMVREGVVHIESNERLAGLEAFVQETPTWKIPRKIQFRMISPRRYATFSVEDMPDWTIRLTPKRSGVKTMEVKVMFWPTFRPSVFFIKAAFGFFTILFFLALTVWIVRLILAKPSENGDLTRLIAAGFLGTAATAIVNIAVHPHSFFGFAVDHGVRLLRVLLLNSAWGVVLVLAFLAFRRWRLSLFLWPLVLSAAGFLVYPEFQTPICGDAHQWMSILDLKLTMLFGAEFLSLPLTKAVLELCRVFVPSASASFAQVLTGKLMGVLTLFALTILVSGEKGLPREKKALFLILASTFGFHAFFFGYPEFAYYSLPFLLTAAVSARRYLDPEDGRNLDLVLTAVWTAVAGLFHGASWIVLPAVFLLPLFRKRPEGQPSGLGTWIGGWVSAGMAAAAVLFVAFGTARALGLAVSFQNALGGGDHGMFVDFFSGRTTISSGILVFEQRYLWERTWALFLAIPLPLIVWAALSLRKMKENASNRFWLMAGSFLLVIFYFWNFDLGYRDFDLYTVPLILIALFLMKSILDTRVESGAAWWEPALVFFFALMSPALLILEMTTNSFF